MSWEWKAVCLISFWSTLTSIVLFPYYRSQWGPATIWLQVWNNLRGSKWWQIIHELFLYDGFVSYKHTAFCFSMLTDGLEWCGSLVVYCDVFISCLDSHSDGTHSLKRIHWWTNDVMPHFSKSVPMKKHIYIFDGLRVNYFPANTNFRWTIPLTSPKMLAWEAINNDNFIFEWTITFKKSSKSAD